MMRDYQHPSRLFEPPLYTIQFTYYAFPPYHSANRFNLQYLHAKRLIKQKTHTYTQTYTELRHYIYTVRVSAVDSAELDKLAQ